MTIFELLPTPVHSNISRIKNSEDIESDFDQNFVQEESKLISTAQEKNSRQVGENRNIRIPVYGKRSNWVPRSKEDFGEGGAYPEIHVAQYPGDFEKNKSQSSNALVKTFDNEGNVKYDSILRGNDQSGAKVIHATPHSMTGKYVNLDSIQQETEEEVIQTTAETSNALERLLNRKISTTIKAKIPESKPQEKSEYIRYTPAFGIPDSKSGVRQRIVKMVDAQIDPILPNAYNVNRKVPRGPPSPPAPVLHSPPRKISTKEAQDWKVPPCISNWKNPRGYTIPLHMRVAADGRNLENISINENFAKMSESLYLAESNARKAVEYRATIEKKKKQKEKERQEAKLRKLAEDARHEMSELKHHPAASTSNISGTTTASAREREEMAMRDEIRQERARARQRDRNLQNAAPEKRSRIERERERNISEKIAIGQPIISSGNSETMYDERLFDNSKGIDAGFNHEEEFNAYDKPWASDKNVGRAIYHPSKNVDEEVYGYDLDKLASGKKFVPDKHFKGADAKTGAVPKDGPVEFQEDPFGLDEFFQEVKQGKKK